MPKPDAASLISSPEAAGFRPPGTDTSGGAALESQPGQKDFTAHAHSSANEAGTDATLDPARPLSSSTVPELQPGQRLGPWMLCAVLGEGGMGRVFLAQRSDGHFEQSAAIKLLRPQKGRRAAARLAQERQILAGLNHPNIARLIDGGTTPAGQPYLVMEHVQGLRIDLHCKQESLGLQARLNLFVQVCQAVDYLHRQFVLHCDIKPGNVLIDPEGMARLLDFGIARLDGDTGEAFKAFTPRYASPEQRAGQPVSVASDVYSLGKLLENLLSMPGLGSRRSCEWQAIVACACAEKPESRYASVAALLEDLSRFQQHLPLQAVAPSWFYRGKKGLRRNWPWALTGLGVLLLCLGFSASLMAQRDRAVRAQEMARHEAATTRRVSELLAGLFEGADPQRIGRPDLSAAAVVDQGRERILRDLSDEPALQGELLAVLGRVYRNMGRPGKAIDLWEQALPLLRAQQARQLRNAAEDESDADSTRRLLARVTRELAYELSNAQQAARALPLARESVSLLEDGGDTQAYAASLSALGWVLSRTGGFAESRRLLDEAFRMQHELLPADHPELVTTLHNLGRLDQAEGKLETAEARFRKALALLEPRQGRSGTQVLNNRNSLGMVLAAQGRYEEAGQELQELLKLSLAVYGPGTAPVALAQGELAGIFQDSGQIHQAIRLYRQVLATHLAINGPESAAVAVARNNLATALEEAGDRSAEAEYRASLKLRLAQEPPNPLSIARGQVNLGRWLLRHRRFGEARQLLQAAQATRSAELPARHPDVMDSQLALAEWSLAQKQSAEAQIWLSKLAEGASDLRPAPHAQLLHLQGLYRWQTAQTPADLALARTLLKQAQRGMTSVHAKHPKRLRLEADLERLEAEIAGGRKLEPGKATTPVASSTSRQAGKKCNKKARPAC